MNKSLGEILLGLLVLIVGVGFLLSALNILEFGGIIRTWWPLIVVGVGLASLVSNPRVFGWPLLIMAFGVLLQLRQLDIVTFNVWSLVWPTIIVVLGLHLLFGRNRPKEVDADSIDVLALFSGYKANSTSTKLKGGRISAVFGGMELDLTDAKLAKGASLDVFAALGGIEIKVPEGWNVKISGLPIMGGWENKTKAPKGEDAPALNIRGTCFMGGVSVKN